jgi:hypothetical protein
LTRDGGFPSIRDAERPSVAFCNRRSKDSDVSMTGETTDQVTFLTNGK